MRKQPTEIEINEYQKRQREKKKKNNHNKC